VVERNEDGNSAEVVVIFRSGLQLRMNRKLWGVFDGRTVVLRGNISMRVRSGVCVTNPHEVPILIAPFGLQSQVDQGPNPEFQLDRFL
jgi:mannose-6-phosphate isomerase-like protein (cupin superfamily)